MSDGISHFTVGDLWGCCEHFPDWSRNWSCDQCGKADYYVVKSVADGVVTLGKINE